MLQKRTGVVKKALLTWGTNVGGLGAIPASPGGFPGRDWVKKRELTHPVATPDPTPSRQARLRPSDTSPGEMGKEVPGPRGRLPLPIPHIKG